MDTLSDYIQWMGEYPISMTGFRDADALVLCALSYIDMSPVFSRGTEECRVRDCREMIESGQLRVMITGGDEGDPELLAHAAVSHRFGDLRMGGYTDVFRPDPPLQFSALCFHDDTDFSFLAFRGTDNTLAGWKEDFMISIHSTEAQELALRCAEEQITPGRRWYMGGQSKGSNLALYAACLMSDAKWEAVERLYLLDGPGLCPEVLDKSLLGRIDCKTTQIVPQFCVVGKLFAPIISDTRIIRSSASGFLQHALISWGIDHGEPALCEAHSAESLLINRAVDEWISNMSPSDRVVFIDELFDALAAGGADTLDELGSGGRAGIEAIIRRLGESSEVTRRTLSDLPKLAVKHNLEKLRGVLSTGMDAILKKRDEDAPAEA